MDYGEFFDRCVLESQKRAFEIQADRVSTAREAVTGPDDERGRGAWERELLTLDVMQLRPFDPRLHEPRLQIEFDQREILVELLMQHLMGSGYTIRAKPRHPWWNPFLHPGQVMAWSPDRGYYAKTAVPAGYDGSER